MEIANITPFLASQKLDLHHRRQEFPLCAGELSSRLGCRRRAHQEMKWATKKL